MNLVSIARIVTLTLIYSYFVNKRVKTKQKSHFLTNCQNKTHLGILAIIWVGLILAVDCRLLQTPKIYDRIFQTFTDS